METSTRPAPGTRRPLLLCALIAAIVPSGALAESVGHRPQRAPAIPKVRSMVRTTPPPRRPPPPTRTWVLPPSQLDRPGYLVGPSALCPHCGTLFCSLDCPSQLKWRRQQSLLIHGAAHPARQIEPIVPLELLTPSPLDRIVPLDTRPPVHFSALCPRCGTLLLVHGAAACSPPVAAFP